MANSASYSVGWIAAHPYARAAALMMMDEIHKEPKDFVQNGGDQNSYVWGRVSKHNVVIASLPAGQYGLVSAANTAGGMRSSLPHIRIGLLVGIGAGIPDKHDILLGDVVVSNPDGTNGGVVQYDFYKGKGDNDSSYLKERKGFLSSPPQALLSALSAIQAKHEIEDSKIEEFLNIYQGNKKLKIRYAYPGSEKDILREHDPSDNREKPRTSPEIHYGTIASGNVLIKNAQERDSIVAWLEKENVKPICFEMEAAGLMNNFPCLVIRGVCNYADEHKNDVWQRYSAATAAAFAKELLGYMRVEEMALTPKLVDLFEYIQGTRKIMGDAAVTKELQDVHDLLPVASNAPFNSYNRQHEPACLPETRVDLLQDI